MAAYVIAQHHASISRGCRVICLPKSYTPLIGMTSMTDPKGMTTYYEYDGFQRLMNVKDQDGNIVKSYNYHYKP